MQFERSPSDQIHLVVITPLVYILSASVVLRIHLFALVVNCVILEQLRTVFTAGLFIGPFDAQILNERIVGG